ncbi:hypothetical protein ACHAWF_010740 [Thalassiosira exigua]
MGNPPPSSGATARPPTSGSNGAPDPPPPTKRPSRWPTRPPSRRPTPAPLENPTNKPALVWLPAPTKKPSTAASSPITLTNDVYLYGRLRSSYFCAAQWGDWTLEKCNRSEPCPTGLHGSCPDGEKCFSDAPCAELRTPRPTPRPTWKPTRPSFEGDPAKRFCGRDWVDVTRNCLTAVPCPGGYAEGVCPYGLNCYADTPCADDGYLESMGVEPADVASGQQLDPSTTGADLDTIRYCSSNRECPFGSFCNQGESGTGGYCGDCLLSNGMGCSTEQVCRESGCGIETLKEYGLAKCYFRSRLDELCGEQLDNAHAQCEVSKMTCDVPKQASVAQLVSSEYQNPPRNNFFCGSTHRDIAQKCLDSKPCPTGVAATQCDGTDGCFYVPNCSAEYESVSNVSNPTQPTLIQSKRPTFRPTRNPTPNPTSKQLMLTPSFITTQTNKPNSLSLLKPTQSTFASFQQVEGPNNTQGASEKLSQPTNSNADSYNSQPGTNDGSKPMLIIDEGSPAQNQQRAELCNLCEGSVMYSSQRISLGNNQISCGDIESSIFLSESIVEGSDGCMNFRGQYSSICCATTLISIDLEPCTICGSDTLDWKASVSFSGEMESCQELHNKILVDEIRSDSPSCKTSQNAFSGSCCIHKPDNPCNLCSSGGGVGFRVVGNAQVMYDGKLKTCQEVESSLHSTQEQLSEICMQSHKELFDLCCEAIDEQPYLKESTNVAVLSPTASPVSKNPTDFDKWFTLASSAQKSYICFVTIAIGELVRVFI